MNHKIRYKIINKIAQTTNVTLPSDAVAQNKTIPSAPIFEASNAYPSLRKGYNSNTVQVIDSLISLLNEAIHYATAGALNFQKLKDNSFNFDASQSPSTDQKNLMLFSKKVFETLLNFGHDFTNLVAPQKIAEMVDTLSSSLELNSLTKINPNSPIVKKIPANIKTSITNYLNYLKLANPFIST